MGAKKSVLSNNQRKMDIGTKARLVPLDDIIVNQEFQPRYEMSREKVREYTERMKKQPGETVRDPEGREWDPLQLRRIDGEVYLVDGFHRFEAARKNGYANFQAITLSMTRQAAFEESLSFNARHGLTRSNADKQYSVQRALMNPVTTKLTNNAIAKLCAVTGNMVKKYRTMLAEQGVITIDSELQGVDGRAINTDNIGNHKKTPKPSKTDFQVRKKQDITTEVDEDIQQTRDHWPYNPIGDTDEGVLAEYTKQHTVEFYGAVASGDWSKLANNANRHTVYITPKPKARLINQIFTNMNNTPAGSIFCRKFIGINGEHGFRGHYEVWIWGGEDVPEVFDTPSGGLEARYDDEKSLVRAIKQLLDIKDPKDDAL